ncbi:MAG: glycogen debranching enzyme N-terminal domain-containing protein [Candidatus Bathyarchaeota archaeon]|nr:glycogen debranching enzyme N-terminal domain-containing protein [Candidatus Bathyarchaeota archaeon]
MKLPSIAYPKEALSRFDEVMAKEWLITNGLGSYASSTVLGINTRKYHGLLVAALNPPGDRTVCLVKLDEDLLVGGSVFRLGSNEFIDSIYPDGYRLIEQFSVDPHPTYVYEAGNVRLVKTIFLINNKNAVAVVYRVQNRNPFDIKVRLYPLLTCRHFHTVVDRFRFPFKFTQASYSKEFQVMFQSPKATVVCRSTDGLFREGLNWVDRLYFREETLRGESNVDDCFQPGFFDVRVPAGGRNEFAITCAVNHAEEMAKQTLDGVGSTIREIHAAYVAEQGRLEDLLAKFYHDHPGVPMSDWLNWVLLSADSFMVKSAAGRKAVIAGYFWFETWGRDTFISLPGLMLVNGHFADAKDVLQNFVQYCKGGLIPNFVADETGLPVYNTVDGTLWYVNAVLQYVKYTGDLAFVRAELWDRLQAIVENHRKGTQFGIRLDDDGLLKHGPGLTWMDAVVDGEMITPRAGKAVEIQALWYNALRTMVLLANKFGELDLAKDYAAMADQTMRTFNEKYWNASKRCLYDVLDPDGVDASVRPNQVFAVSLDYTMLNGEKSRDVVKAVKQELLTPFGLRTLSVDDPKFVAKCQGDRRSRDVAYHNGTIWPWLLGPYVTAYLKVNDYSAESRQEMLKELVLPFFSVGIHQDGLGTISEIYDCEPPNAPRGCIAQAWSIAEPLRAYIEDILLIKPKFA